MTTASFEDRRRATVLTWLLLFALALGTGYDLVSLMTDPAFAARLVPTIVARDGIIVVGLILTWSGWTRTADHRPGDGRWRTAR